jgi:hypothetical protein
MTFAGAFALVLLMALAWHFFVFKRERSDRTYNRELDASIRRAVDSGVVHENLHEFVSLPPTVDTSTEEGRARHEMSVGLSLDPESAKILAQARTKVYWIVKSTDREVIAAGIAWDEQGKPHYFSAPFRYLGPDD